MMPVKILKMFPLGSRVMRSKGTTYMEIKLPDYCFLDEMHRKLSISVNAAFSGWLPIASEIRERIRF